MTVFSVSLMNCRTTAEPMKPAPPVIRIFNSAAPPVHIVETHDVVLAEVGARLHLDDLVRQRARIFLSVLHADEKKQQKKHQKQKNQHTTGDARRAAHHHPVLSAVMM